MTITGDRLRELRREKGKTLREVNVDTGISYSGLASVERGENSCNTSTLKILADYYDVLLIIYLAVLNARTSLGKIKLKI